MKGTIVLDFDGVIHSYSSGWKGAATIQDAPVPGALEFVVGLLDHFQVAILSSRSHQWGGRRAMKKWLYRHLVELGNVERETPRWWISRISRTAFADPWPDEVDWAAKRVIAEIKWPLFKPAALITIDDRALTFNGDWTSQEYQPAALSGFKPWNKRRAA